MMLIISKLSFLGVGTTKLKIRDVTAPTQDSRKHGAENLIDENASTFYASSDYPPKNAWVQFELATVATVRNIKITNRMDCCGHRLYKMEVKVGDAKVTVGNIPILSWNPICGNYTGPGKDGEIVTIQCSKPLKGRYVSIIALASVPQKINMAEVEIFE